eukprot:CAMPEP_0174709252 /NCGR_PEP_ID=MMETSP1094-20130205/11273_1 /TAXON_ID=156173 /ORGANISM="Chrysochromulina brevifilum, Strain UTEX LB 985" /LENGTH=41 /DNA_ID= /DNA_START= /DNA_END= /DNA_ORIENTATION=
MEEFDDKEVFNSRRGEAGVGGGAYGVCCKAKRPHGIATNDA